jgi:hypothetical protein
MENQFPVFFLLGILFAVATNVHAYSTALPYQLRTYTAHRL